MKKFFIASAAVLGLMVTSLGVLWLLTPSAADLVKDFEESKTSNSSSVLYDVDGGRIEISSLGTYRFLPFERMPDGLKKAILSAQDVNFYQHSGFDLVSQVKAVRKQVKGQAGRFTGNTITQRFVGQVMYGEPATFFEKLKVFFATKKLEAAFEKDQIFEFFLNSVLMSGDVRGVETASSYYFGKSASGLNVAESAFLAALTTLPLSFDVKANYEAIKAKQLLIIQEMAQHNFIKFQNIGYWYKKPLRLSYGQNVAKGNYAEESSARIKQYVYSELRALGFETGDGLEVYTTLDKKRMQLMSKFVEDIRKRGIGFSRPQALQFEIADTEISSGAIRALAAYGVPLFKNEHQAKDRYKDLAIAQTVADGHDLMAKLSWDKESYYELYFANPNDLIAAYGDSIRTNLPANYKKETADELPLMSLRDNIRLALPVLNLGKDVEPYIVTKVQTVGGKVLYEREKYSGDAVMKPQLAFVAKALWNHFGRYVLKVGSVTSLLSGQWSEDSSYANLHAMENGRNLISLWAGHDAKKGYFVSQNKTILEIIAKRWYDNYRDEVIDAPLSSLPKGVSFKKIRRDNWGISAASQVRNIPYVNL